MWHGFHLIVRSVIMILQFIFEVIEIINSIKDCNLW